MLIACRRVMSCGPCLLALSRVDIPGVGQARWCLVAATLSTRSKSFCLAIFSWYIVIESSFSLCHQVCSCLHMCRYTAFPVWPLLPVCWGGRSWQVVHQARYTDAYAYVQSDYGMIVLYFLQCTRPGTTLTVWPVWRRSRCMESSTLSRRCRSIRLVAR